MKFSYQWLADLVPGLSMEPARLERLITMKTAECEGVEAFGPHFDDVIVARVLNVEALAKGRNKLVSIDAGERGRHQVVCGAPNVSVGMLAAWVPPGTTLGGKVIDRVMIENVESEGMLASSAELGINRDHSGLLQLHGLNPGQPLPHLKPDWIIDIDNKSLTHRPDLWGHFGMAREVAAISGGTLRDPVHMGYLPAGAAAVKVSILEQGSCPRYSALLVENAQAAESPLWLQARLESVGLNAINNVVDITNYVLAELPQPMHAFDADKLRGDTIFVRLAKAGEHLRALNGESYALTPEDLVIADAGGPIALAGVIGGAESAISPSTTRILLESANFLASRIRLTSSRHRLRTDASMRFEKSLDPENTTRGLARAAQLLREILPQAEIRGGVADSRGTSVERTAAPPIPLPVSFVSKKLGQDTSQEQVTTILSALEFGVEEIAPGLLNITVPSWRATKDISHKDDLVEEIGRMLGYGEIVPVAPLAASVVPSGNPMRTYLRHLRQQLVDQGFTEVYNYSFIDETDIRRFNLKVEDLVTVLNPIVSGQSHLRSSLLPGLFRNIVVNAKNFEDFRIFEVGHEIHAGSGSGTSTEVPHAAAALYNLHANEEDFFELKRVLEAVLPGARVRGASASVFEHPARTAEVIWQETQVGRLAELHPFLVQQAGLSGRAFYFDIDLAVTQALQANQSFTYAPIRKYPNSGFDLSVVAEMTTPVSDIEDHLRELGGADLVTIYFVRQYSGPPLAEGQKSVSYHIEAGSLDHTLTTEEAGEIRARLIEGMRGLGYDFRT